MIIRLKSIQHIDWKVPNELAKLKNKSPQELVNEYFQLNNIETRILSNNEYKIMDIRYE